MKNILILAVSIILLSACNSAKKVGERDLSWPNYVRKIARDMNCNDKRRLAIIDQIDNFYKLVEDTTTSADVLCQSLKRLDDTLEYVILNDFQFEFTMLMRATEYQISEKLMAEDDRTKQCSRSLGISDYWNTAYCSDSLDMDVMSVSWFGSLDMFRDRFAILNVMTTEDVSLSELIVENLVDYSMDSLECLFATSDLTIIGVINAETAYIVDSSDMHNGLIRMIVPTIDVLDVLEESDIMLVRYLANGNWVALPTYAPHFFNYQVKGCPRLVAMMNGTRQ